MGVRECFEKYYKEDCDCMQSWCDEIYASACGTLFDNVRAIAKRMDSKISVITDSELEWIITTLPLNLFTISETLNQIRLKQEYTKLKYRDMKEKQKKYRGADSELTECIDCPDDVESELVIEAFGSVIKRIENEVSYSRELIMGAKKVWDSRKRAEGSLPIGEVNPSDNLPDYSSSGVNPHKYIK